MSGKGTTTLGLRVGDYVEVRSIPEILATLGEDGALDSMPFMPEMLEFCGRRFRVFKRADKTCDNIQPWSLRAVKDAVHLEGVRCDGAGHDGCEAGCMIFWKEAWLKKVEHQLVAANSLKNSTNGRAWDVSTILSATRVTAPEGDRRYSCQATEVLNFTSELAWWDIRQYIRDLRSGNLRSCAGGNSRTERALETVLGAFQLGRTLLIELFNAVQKRRRGVIYPQVEGQAKATRVTSLDLQPGELITVRSKEEILTTLDHKNRNRGLLFEAEMLRYCGGIYRVLRRVHRIVDEKTGKMLEMKHPCIVLEGVYCQSDYHRFCPRAIYHYWRESWLKRAEAGVPAAGDGAGEAVCASSGGRS